MGKRESISITEVLSLLSDTRSLTLFNHIASFKGKADGPFLCRSLNLTPKQFYGRLSRLLTCGLLIRKQGKYSISAFGKVIFDAQNLIGIALNAYWKLSAIDSIQSSGGLSQADFNKLVNSLLVGEKIRQVLASQAKEDNPRDVSKNPSLPLLQKILLPKLTKTGGRE